MLAQLGVPFTGGSAASLAACGDKVLAKRIMTGAELPTPGWSEPPHWRNIGEGRWIVKSATEDASLGLDDDSVVTGREARPRAQARSALAAAVAEFYRGREFNVALIEQNGAPLCSYRRDGVR
jgi:D-alanine-D-alanine ligase